MLKKPTRKSIMVNGSTRIKVLVVDDSPIFRDGLRKALDMMDDIEIVDVVGNGEEALQKVQQLRPNVVLLDVNLPGMNGLQVTRKLKSEQDKTAVIIITGYHDTEQVIHALRTGASAYCAKDIDALKLITIIREVAAGYYFVDDERKTRTQVTEWLDQKIEDNTGPYIIDAEGHYIPLSPREMQILELVTRGMINKEIASELGISQQTVKNHMTSILKKLNVKDRTQAAVTALRRGWVRIDNDGSQDGN